MHLAMRLIKRFGLAIWFVILALAYVKAHAEVEVEAAKLPAIFMIEGKRASPIDADHAARSGSSKIERCTEVKNVISFDSNSKSYRCKRVKLVINSNTGASKWVNL